MVGWIRNDLGKIGLYLVATLLLGAALAPGLFFVGKWLAAGDWLLSTGVGFLAELDRILEETNIQRYYNRAVLVAALVCMIPLVRSIRRGGGGDKGAEAGAGRGLGLERDPARWGHAMGGFCLAAGFLLAMGVVVVKLGVFEWREAGDRKAWGPVVQTALLAALGAGVIEEIFFRGLLLGVCLRAVKRFWAMVFVTALYAGVHFLKPPDSIGIADAEVTWGTGFWLTGQIVSRFGNPVFLVAEFATLFAVGWILGVARLRTRALWASIGLHAGWIFGLKFFSAITIKAAPAAETLPWIGGNVKEGLAPLAVVVLTGVLAMRWLGAGGVKSEE